MKTLGLVLLFLSLGLILAVGLNTWTGLSLNVSLIVSAVIALLLYLMLDLKPENRAGEGTITRLTRGKWRRKS